MRPFPPPEDPDTDVAADPEAVLEGLNEAQREAVRATEGPVLIVAGPGSGKTRALTHRIAYLLAAGKARPWQILALTFTNKAAREMKERVLKLTGKGGAKGMWMGTFHATFARLLRREGDKLGYSSDFSIYDTDDSRRILRGLAGRYQIDTKQFRPRTLHRLISSAKNQMIAPADYRRVASGLTQEKAAQLYAPYQQMLKRSNAMDFDDLLLRPIDLFEQHPDVLEKYQNRWQYLHIDEYQDTNRAQYVLAKMLAQQHKNLCVVGDDAQSIYAFRGADIQNILSFQRDYPDATVIRLEQNYRSTKAILRLADSIIGQNRDQIDKALWTQNDQGEHVVVSEALSERDEAQKIERRIRTLHAREGYAYSDFAVLYRTNAQSRSLENELRRGSIPYCIVGGTSFYQRKEIRDVMAYLRLTVNPNDGASLRRVINYPTRGIGQTTQERLIVYAREQGLTLWQAIDRVGEIGTLSGRAKKAVGRFHFLIARYAAQIESRPADELARDLIKEAGLNEELRKERTHENLVRWENVQELVSAIAEFASSSEEAGLSTFLQEVSLLTDADSTYADENLVTLMTLHAAKGLEYPVVFIAGMEEDLFPLGRAAQDREELEEERRLFYVGATRAEERLYLLHARSRYRYGQQKPCVRSRFLDEVDPDVLRTEAGGAPRQRSGRFEAGDGSSDAYEGVDPHYYRKSLSGKRAGGNRSGGKRSGGKRRKRRAGREGGRSGGGRRVVYDEGEGRIVPGVRVEHRTFGEGKVISMDGRGEKATAVVFFPDVGQKKLKLKFAGLRRVE